MWGAGKRKSRRPARFVDYYTEGLDEQQRDDVRPRSTSTPRFPVPKPREARREVDVDEVEEEIREATREIEALKVDLQRMERSVLEVQEGQQQNGEQKTRHSRDVTAAKSRENSPTLGRHLGDGRREPPTRISANELRQFTRMKQDLHTRATSSPPPSRGRSKKAAASARSSSSSSESSTSRSSSSDHSRASRDQHSTCPGTMPGHNQKDFEERGGKMGYMTKHPSEKDPETGRPLKVFTPVSNFTFDIKEKITGDDAGFLVEITCHADDKKGLRYIPIGASRADFCIHANKTLGDADWGGLNTSMSDVAFRTLLVNKQLDFETTPPVKSRRGTTIVGKVEDEDIWVFNDEVHLEAVEDEHGQWHVKTVKKGEQKYKLLPSTLNQTANVTLPLTLDPMLVAVPVMKEAFQHNFHSAIFVLGHSCMGMHAEIVASRFDSCPVTIAVGQSGLGKTMAVRTALAMLGIGDTGLIRQFKREAMVSMASRTTLGCFLDDPQSLNARKEAAIDFHGMGVFYTLSRGVESAKCGFLMTANHPLFQPEERDLRRMNYLPFFGPKISDTGGAKSRVDLKMMRDEGRLSSCMRTLVSIGISFRTEGWKEVLEMQKKWVLELPGVMKDILLNYSILLWFTNKVSINLGVSLDDIETFRKEHIVPYIKQYMCEAAVHDDMKLSVLSAVREDVASWITGADPEELDDTVRIGFVSYSKQPSMPAVESLLVTSESLASAVVVPAATVREYLKATNQGMSTTLPYRVQGKNKRFTVFKWDCFTPDQQTGIRNAIKKEQAEKLTTDNATETEPEDRPAARDTATETEPENEPAASDTATETEPEDRPAARDTAMDARKRQHSGEGRLKRKKKKKRPKKE